MFLYLNGYIWYIFVIDIPFRVYFCFFVIRKSPLTLRLRGYLRLA